MCFDMHFEEPRCNTIYNINQKRGKEMCERYENEDTERIMGCNNRLRVKRERLQVDTQL